MKKTPFLALCLLLSTQSAVAASTSESGDRYDELVRQARSGNTAPVLAYLKRNVKTQTPQQQEDHIVIAAWAGKDQEVINAYAQVHARATLAPSTLGSAAKAYRNLGEYARAAELYREAQMRAPEDRQWVLGEMLALADGGRGRDAVVRGQQILAGVDTREQARIRTVMAYAWLSAGLRYEALHEIHQAFMSKHPGPFEAELLERYGQVLTRTELPLAALEMDAGLTPVQRLQKQSDEMALRVRMSDYEGRQEAERYRVPDELITRYHALLDQCAATLGAEGVARQMRIDRLGAYEARDMHFDVIREYIDLSQSGPVPIYAKTWVAQAHAELREPEQAAALMKDVVAHETPKDEQWTKDHLALIGMLLESDRPSDARTAMDVFMPSVPRYHWSVNYPLPHVNGEWLNTQVINTGIQQASGDERKALASGERLCRIAPGQTDPCLNYGGLLAEHGQPRAAEHEYLMVQTTQPRGQSLETAQAVNALDLREWARADLMADALRARYADYSAARQAVRLNDIAHMAELRITASKGHSHAYGEGSAQGASNPVRGNDDLQFEGTLYSPRFGNHWRAYTGAAYTSGDFVTREPRTDNDSEAMEYGTSTDRGRWQRLGAEYTDRNTVATAEASVQHFGAHGRQQAGGRITLDRDISDSWHYGVLYAFRSTEAPLRARTQGLWANQTDMHVAWTPSHRTAWQFALSPWHFSDGNWRWQASANGHQRLWTWPHAKLDGLVSISASRNSLGHVARENDQIMDGEPSGVDYYSPTRDLSVMPGLRLTHALYHRYETQWEHSLELGTGRYYEDYMWCDGQASCSTRHDSSPLWMARYGHDLRLNDVLDAGAFVQVTRQSYDGVSERDVQLLLDINYRF